MPEEYLAKYHVREQQADALLAPVRLELAALAHRMQHYLDRVKLGSDADANALRQAHTALDTAYREIERLWLESANVNREDTKARRSDKD